MKHLTFSLVALGGLLQSSVAIPAAEPTVLPAHLSTGPSTSDMRRQNQENQKKTCMIYRPLGAHQDPVKFCREYCKDDIAKAEAAGESFQVSCIALKDARTEKLKGGLIS